MATDINTGNPIRFQHTGKVIVVVSSVEYAPLYVIPGTFRFKPGLTGRIPVMDRGVFTPICRVGDERASEMSFDINPTKLGFTGASDVIAFFRPAASAGNHVLRTVIAEIPDSPGGSAGTRATFERCYMPDGEEYAAGAEQELDRMTIRLACMDAEPAYATY